MPLKQGFRLGVYEVIDLVAIGGMGEVYRARDTTLGRDVAIKVLTEIANGDPTSEARFEREARAVAALSHPNIIAIHGFAIEDGIAYAVSEWLEGRTLRHELDRGSMAVRRVIHIGTQIALGLAAAHDRGIVHRDIKPENVFITADGQVKVLDFGLARVAADALAGLQDEGTPVVTRTGVLFGTVGYTSPEQVAGSPSDHRSDLFSLGVVLFEMLTGHSAFRRNSAIETCAAILKEEPPLIASFTSGVPSSLERIVMRCLEKSPAERFQSARDLAFGLAQVAAPSGVFPAAETVPPFHPVYGRWGFVAAVTLIIGVWLAAALFPRHWSAPRDLHQPLVTFTIAPPPGTALANVPARMLAISPSGDRLVFAVTKGGRRELWVRYLATTKAEPLPGTEDATEPFWSPDEQYVGFFADSKLKRVGLDGAPSTTLCHAPLDARGGAWNDHGQIIFADAYGGLSRVAATGGVATRMTIPRTAPTPQRDSWPQFLPDGRRFMFLREDGTGGEDGATAYLGALAGGDPHALLSGVFNALFVAPDRILFTGANRIAAQRVDVDGGRMIGEDEELSADVDRHLGHAALAVSRSGTLAYATAGSRDHRLVWVDRQGHEVGAVANIDGWRDVALSPDGSRLAVQRIVADANDIWTIDLARGVPSRFTLSTAVDDDPVWSPDGKTIAFSSMQGGMPGIYRQPVSGAGSGELLFTNRASVHPTAWSPDGRFLLFEQTDPVSGSDVWVLPLQGDHMPRAYLASRFSESDAHFSADGQWVAYTSDESGRQEVYVRHFPDAQDKVQVSTGGGAAPRWAPDGHELYFLSIDRQPMAVPMRLTNPLQVGLPARLFEMSAGFGANRYAPNHDGTRFLLSVGVVENNPAEIVVVLNWAAHLRGR